MINLSFNHQTCDLALPKLYDMQVLKIKIGKIVYPRNICDNIQLIKFKKICERCDMN